LIALWKTRFLRILGQNAWRNGLNFPIYVPTEMKAIRSLLSVGAVSETCAELWRLATLGSDQAAAVLAFMSLRGIEWKGEDPNRILRRCQQAATNGDSYAQFVMGLNEKKLHNHSKEAEWLQLATMKEFGPALAESGILAASVARRPDLARIYFYRGVRARHIPSLIFFLSYCVRGTYGWCWRILGMAALPLAMIVMIFATRYFPYSLPVFSHLFARDRPLFEKRAKVDW